MLACQLEESPAGVASTTAMTATPAVWWVIDHQFAMNALEPLFWTGCAYALLRMIHTQNPKLWLPFGVIAGLGLENKYSIAIFAFALLFGLLLTQHRKLLFTPWLFAGGGAALLIFLPNLIWNFQHHWPFLELMHNNSRHRQRHRLPARRLHRPANPDDESLQLSILVRRPALLFVLPRREKLSRFRLGLPHHLRVFPGLPRQRLLFRPRQIGRAHV